MAAVRITSHDYDRIHKLWMGRELPVDQFRQLALEVIERVRLSEREHAYFDMCRAADALVKPHQRRSTDRKGRRCG